MICIGEMRRQMQPIEKLENCGESNCLTFIHFGEGGEENFMELQIGLC
jgi:hypothetical protein